MASVQIAAATRNGSGPSKPPTKARGATGTQNSRGYIQTGEMTSEFRGQNLFRTVDRMVRSDPVVRAALLMVVLPLTEAEYTVTPAGADDQDKEAAELVRRALLEHNDWPQVVWDLASSALKYGRGVSEEVYESVEWELSYDTDEGQVEVPRRVYWVPARFGPRLASTITEWHVDDNGDLEAVVQQLPSANGMGRGSVTIEADRLVVWVNEREGDNYHGVSVFRCMYRPWYAKEKLEVIDAIRAEKAGVGTAKGWAGDGDSERLEAAAKSIRANEEGVIVLEGAPPGADGHHQDVELMDMRAASTADVQASLHYFSTQILWGVLGAWQNLGQGTVGARATSETQDDPFYLFISSLAARFVAVINRQVVPRLVGFNYPTDRCPQVQVATLPGADFGSVVDGLAKLLTAGGMTSDLELENYLRRKMGVPERKEEEGDPADELVPEGEGVDELPEGVETPDPEDESDDPTQQGEPPATEEPAEARPVTVQPHKRRVVRGGRRTIKEVGQYARKMPHKVQLAARDLLSGLLADEMPEAVAQALGRSDPALARREAVTTTMADGSEFTSWRQLTELERHVLFQATDRTIEEQRQEYERAAADQVAAMARYHAGAADKDGDLAEPEVVKLTEDLAEAIEGVLRRTADFARVAVRSEIASQRGQRGEALTIEAAGIALADRPPVDPERLDDWIRRTALGSARAVSSRVSLAAGRAGRRLQQLPSETILSRVESAGQSALRAEAVATVAHAMAAGRRAETEEAAERGEAGQAVYSAILDTSTCDPCRSLDQAEYEVGSAAYERDYPPLYACAGQDACRCMMIVVAAEETVDPTAR